MLLMLLLLALGAGWAWKNGGKRLVFGDAAAIVAVVIALRELQGGRLLPALVAFGGAGYWFWRRKQGSVSPSVDAEEARRLLDLPRGADEGEIRAAHRRLVARVHPDAGGSAELARRVNAARDTLLRELRAR